MNPMCSLIWLGWLFFIYKFGHNFVVDTFRYDSIRFGNCVPDKNALAQQLISSRNDALNSVVRRRIFAGNYFNLEE
jgi:hypothetical protein